MYMKKFSFYQSVCCCLLILLSFSLPAYSQAEKDFETRLNTGVSVDLGKQASLSAGYRLTLFDNSTRFKSSFFSFGGNYDLLKWLRVAAEYRYYTTRDMDYHRFLVSARAGYKVNKKIDVYYRLRYQQEQDYFDREYLQFENAPQRVFRNQLLAKYQYTKKVDFYLYTESFTDWSKSELNTYRLRYGAGVNYLYKKRHAFTFEVFANDEFGISDPTDRFTLDLGYVFKIRQKKDKKEKVPKDPAAATP
ncbi:MAG: DUF2490 domain-containing protein [Sphingobacteriales bacterium]|nr:MAG: DUF2490 domain-containing protein [Sphingobacteriales bacterium]